MTCQKVEKVVSKSLVLNPSKWVHILCSAITAIYFSYFFVSVVHLRTLSHLSHTVLKLRSFLWMWTLRPHFWAKMFDVTDLPVVLTFGNCVLQTGVIKWPLKLYGRCFTFFTFFPKSKNVTFYVFWVVAHIFSNIVDYISCRRMEPTRPKVTAI